MVTYDRYDPRNLQSAAKSRSDCDLPPSSSPLHDRLSRISSVLDMLHKMTAALEGKLAPILTAGPPNGEGGGGTIPQADTELGHSLEVILDQLGDRLAHLSALTQRVRL